VRLKAYISDDARRKPPPTFTAVRYVGDIRSVSVGQEGGHIRRGGYVRSADGHDPQGVPHSHGARQRTQSRLQRGAVRL